MGKSTTCYAHSCYVTYLESSDMSVYLLYRPTRNPYDCKKIAGGSSGGSASLVSAGLCPVALGVDGGGIWFICVDTVSLCC